MGIHNILGCNGATRSLSTYIAMSYLHHTVNALDWNIIRLCIYCLPTQPPYNLPIYIYHVYIRLWCILIITGILHSQGLNVLADNHLLSTSIIITSPPVYLLPPTCGDLAPGSPRAPASPAWKARQHGLRSPGPAPDEPWLLRGVLATMWLDVHLLLRNCIFRLLPIMRPPWSFPTSSCR